MAQRKRVGLITQRSLDRNQVELSYFWAHTTAATHRCQQAASRSVQPGLVLGEPAMDWNTACISIMADKWDMQENCMYEKSPVATLCKTFRFTCICEDPSRFCMRLIFCTGLFLRGARHFWGGKQFWACLLAMLACHACGDWICKIHRHLTFGSNLHFLVCVGSIK